MPLKSWIIINTDLTRQIVTGWIQQRYYKSSPHLTNIKWFNKTNIVNFITEKNTHQQKKLK